MPRGIARGGAFNAMTKWHFRTNGGFVRNVKKTWTPQRADA